MKRASKEIATKFQLKPLPHPKNMGPEYYIQYSGACGLASILMAIKPVARQIDSVLDQIWNHIKPLFSIDLEENNDKNPIGTLKSINSEEISQLIFDSNPSETTTINESDNEGIPSEISTQKIESSIQRSYRWQIVLEWLLFETARNKKLQDYLRIHIGEDFDELFLPKLTFRIKRMDPKIIWASLTPEEQYFLEFKPEDLNQLNGEWILRRVKEWKEDFELKILSALFGMQFIPWKRNKDGTGSLHFLEKEQKSRKNRSYKKKLKFIKSELKSNKVIILIEEDHWKILRELVDQEDKYYKTWAVLQDPLSGKDIKRAIQTLYEFERFYFFELSPKILSTNLKMFENIINEN
jgi:hypothetical protein